MSDLWSERNKEAQIHTAHHTATIKGEKVKKRQSKWEIAGPGERERFLVSPKYMIPMIVLESGSSRQKASETKEEK